LYTKVKEEVIENTRNINENGLIKMQEIGFKEFKEIEKDYDFIEILDVFRDIVYDPSENNINNILMEYEQDKDRIMYGYFLDKKLAGIIGIKNNLENIEVLHFGVHPEYRGNKLGTELMDYIKEKGKTIILSTDDDAIKFYEKYGFKHTKYFNEKYQKIRYNCVYEQ